MNKKWLMGLGAVLVVVTLATVSLAGPGWGRGWGGGPMMGGGPGSCWGAGGGPGSCWGPGADAQLSPEQTEQLTQLRQQHWQDVAPLRDQIWSKKQELWNLRSQQSPDPQALSKLEREIFDLQSTMREKGFAYRQEMQKIDPDLHAGFGGGGRGPRGMGPGWGRGRMGRGPCWGADQ
jgi:Spy/CpxP family protein refolding chaperone